MGKECIYFGQEQRGDRLSETYMIVHRLYEGHEALRFCQGLSFEYLAGYLDGATAGRWSRVDLRNGIPVDLADNTDTRPLQATPLTRLLKQAQLSDHYRHLMNR